MNEVLNNELCLIVSSILKPFGYNRVTYRIFSFFFGMGYRYSFGSIRFEEREQELYMDFMPWFFGNKRMVKNKVYNKVMLYGAYDYMDMIDYFIINKPVQDKIVSHSNKEIAFLIHKKLGFKFKKFKTLKEAKEKSDSYIYELYIHVDDLILHRENIIKYIHTLKKFANRK